MEENKKQGFSSHTEDLPEEMLFSEDYDEDNVLYDTNARIYETDESDAVYDEENAEDDILYDADARYYEEFEENDEENGEEGGEEAIEDSGDDGTDSTMGSGFQADGPGKQPPGKRTSGKRSPDRWISWKRLPGKQLSGKGIGKYSGGGAQKARQKARGCRAHSL